MRNSTYFSQDSGQGFYNVPPQPQPLPPQKPQNYNQPNSGSSSNAIWALVLGILSYVACGIFASILAWIIEKMNLKKLMRDKHLNQIALWLMSECG